MSQPSPVLVDPAVLLGRVAAVLAAGVPLSAALAELVRGLGLRAAVVRAADGELYAVAGDVLHAVPAGRALGTTAPTVELPVPGRSAEPAASLTVVGARPSQLPLLRAAAAVVGLALAGVRPDLVPAARPEPDAVRCSAAALQQAADADLDELADELHDGPVQLLLSARYAADLAARGGNLTLVRTSVQESVVALRRVLWHLRPRADVGLAAAIAALSERVVEAGGPAIVRVGPPSRADDLRGVAAGSAYRLTQSVARPGAPACRVELGLDAGSLVVLLDGGAPLGAPERWTARVHALGGDLTCFPTRLRLTLPIPNLRTTR